MNDIVEVNIDETLSGTDSAKFLADLFEGMDEANVLIALEHSIFNLAGLMSRAEYQGGSWDLVTLSNGGWYYRLTTHDTDDMFCSNPAAYWEGRVSLDAFGLIVTSAACSLLSFACVEDQNERAAGRLADNYHLLRDFIYQDDHPHPEQTLIYRALD